MRKYLLAFIFFIFVSVPAFSQCDDPMDPACESDPDDPVPLDGGVSILIGIGTLYGLKKLNDVNQIDKKENI